MHAVLLTYGSRGDVQPFVALGAGLRAAGHRVTLAAPARFAPMAKESGLHFAGLPGDMEQISRDLVDRGGTSPLRLMRVLYQHIVPLARSVIVQLRETCRSADGIVHTFLMTTAGQLLAQERGIPDISAQLFPAFAPTAAFPSMIVPPRSLGGALNRLSHRLATWMFRWGGQIGYSQVRRGDPTIGPRRLPWAEPGRDTLLLMAFSRHVVPEPADWRPPIHLTGYWQLPSAGWQPPDDLRRFLAAGPPPVYIGFGSMVTRDARRLSAVVLEALRRSGRRGVLLRGWGGLDAAALPPQVLAIDAAPHDWLFPRMAAVIHHGGAGTTGAALRAGVPSLAVPFMADQPFWAERTRQLKVGPEPMFARTMGAEALAAAIEQLDSPRFRQQAAALGARIAAEDGVGRAVALVMGAWS